MNNLLQNMYFITKGDRVGQFLILIDYNSKTKIYSVLGLPESEVMYITKDNIEKGIQNNILDFVETVPKDVYIECKNEFKYRESHK